MLYRHSSPKTPYEVFNGQYLSGFVEKYLIPEFLSPNFITLAGQLPALILIIYIFTLENPADGSVMLPAWIFYVGAFSLQWFSWFDIADGARARRLKCGSPVGRIVDEALDIINQAITPIIIIYGCQANNRYFEFLTLISNAIFYTMEMQYVIKRKLIMIQGDFGPVETELLLALIMFSMGYLTPEFFQTTIGATFTSLEGLPLLGGLKWGFTVLVILLPM